ncbi:MAG: MerR family DNA-binding transcriptional regulator [Candidatus Thioglobus sp.]|nr:MAG: MerR family DNA-binding transcriptional regulator [Candidatus Thioglobus sp.]
MTNRFNEVMTVTELARETGVTARAIRFYESKGLLHPQRAGTTRIYTHRERGRLQLILRGKRLGFSLSDIGDYLNLYDADPTQQDQIMLLLAKVDTRVKELELQKIDLEASLTELSAVKDQALIALKNNTKRVANG